MCRTRTRSLKPREAPLKRKEGHCRTLSGGATHRPTHATRRPPHITPADGRHSRQHPQPGQHTRTIRPSSPDDEREQMQHGLCLPSCRLSSEHVRDFVAIAELKKVDSRELDLILRNQGVTLVQDLEVVRRKRLRHYIPVMSNMRREGQLLPMKFKARFYK